jgi:hypothetical protein
VIPVSVAAVLERIREIDARFGVQDAGSFSHALALATGHLKGAQSVRALPEDERSLVERAARDQGVDPALAMAVLMHESGGNPRAVSPAGAMGLMQLMPETARALDVSDPFDPKQNVLAGVRYLRQKLEEFGSVPLALAAYNAGSGAVLHFGGIPPYPETWRFVDAVLRTRSLEAGDQKTATDAAATVNRHSELRTSPPAGPTGDHTAQPAGDGMAGRRIRSWHATPASDGNATQITVQGNEQSANATLGAGSGYRLSSIWQFASTQIDVEQRARRAQQQLLGPRPDHIDRHGAPATTSVADERDGQPRGQETSASDPATVQRHIVRDVAHQVSADSGPAHERPVQAGPSTEPLGAKHTRPADVDQVQAPSPSAVNDARVAPIDARHADQSGREGDAVGNGRTSGEPRVWTGHGGHSLAAPQAAASSDGPSSGQRTAEHAAQRDPSNTAPDSPAVTPRPGAVHVTLRIGDGERPVNVTVVGRTSEVWARVAAPTQELGHALEVRAGDLKSALASHRIRLADLVVTPAAGEAWRERRNDLWYERRDRESGTEEEGA